MSVLVPLAVRLANGDVDMHVTNQLRDLSFSSVCPGGFASATFSLDSPLALDAPELKPYTQVYIYDTHTARCVWQGWLEEPGRGAGSDGQIWSVTALGPVTRAQDKTEPLIYVDTSLEPWTRTNNTSPGATAGAGANPADTSDDQVLLLQFPNQMTVATNAVVNLKYTVLQDAGLNLGGFGYRYDMGQNNASYELQAQVNNTLYKQNAFTTTQASITPASVDGAGSFVHGNNTVNLRIIRLGLATTITSDTVWAAVSNLWIRGEIYDKTGTYIGGAGTYTNNYVLASDVVADLLGRLLPNYNGAAASIAATTHHIDQLAYPDGITPAQVLDDLMALEPAYFWAAWEGSPARFEWSAWPTTVTYEADINDGYSASNTVEGLYNRVTVRWRDKKSGINSSRYSQNVAVLTDAGIVRRGRVDLGDEVGSQANADRIGAQFLADHAVAANAGSLTLAGPIRNLKTGRVEQPWEVRPGTLIRVRGMPSAPGPLNAAGSDGQSVMRVVSTSYNASSNTAELELDTYSRSLTRAIENRKRRR